MSKMSRKYNVPDGLANLYDFANSLDLRQFTHHHVAHVPADDLSQPSDLTAWMSRRGWLKVDANTTPAMLKTALEFRSRLRDFLACDPDDRRKDKDVLRSLTAAVRPFPLIVEAVEDGTTLQPAGKDALAGLAHIVAELHNASASGALHRLKMCAAEECRRVFFDRSKPGSRRWCQSSLCGNRMKTRAYRKRHQATG